MLAQDLPNAYLGRLVWLQSACYSLTTLEILLNHFTQVAANARTLIVANNPDSIRLKSYLIVFDKFAFLLSSRIDISSLWHEIYCLSNAILPAAVGRHKNAKAKNDAEGKS